MSYEQKPNSGALFKNDKARPNSRDPEYNGSVLVLCPHCQRQTDMWLAAWLNTSKQTGKKFFGLALTPKEEKKTEPKPTEKINPHINPPSDPDNDDVPF